MCIQPILFYKFDSKKYFLENDYLMIIVNVVFIDSQWLKKKLFDY